MLFFAFRLTDAINFLIGVWIVPAYIGVEELGAVMPLATFASLLAVPAGVFATALLKEVNTLAARREYGKIKRLVQGVFVGAGIFMLLALAVCQLIMPYFLERLRISKGSLGILILLSSFAGSICPIYTNTLQALKKFKAISFMNIIGAPIRLVVMVSAMPFRALSGYFAAQASTPMFQIFASVFFLRKELSVKAEHYWNTEVFRRFAKVFLMVMLFQSFSLLGSTVEQMVIRQRLPEIQSAAYYILTRFSEISGFLSGVLSVTLFPYSGELAAKGKSATPLLIKCSLSMLTFGTVLAAFFAICADQILGLIPGGENYIPYAGYIPWLIGINTISAISGFHITSEIAAGRFKFLRWWTATHLLYVASMLATVGHGYYSGLLGPGVACFFERFNITELDTILQWMTVFALIRLIFSIRDLMALNKNVI